MPEFFYLLVNYPALNAVPIIVFASLALWSRSRSAMAATLAWLVYLSYEIGMHTGAICSGQACENRTPLYFGYPMLGLLSAVALVQAYVHIRDKRFRERRPPIER